LYKDEKSRIISRKGDKIRAAFISVNAPNSVAVITGSTRTAANDQRGDNWKTHRQIQRELRSAILPALSMK
jgi:hypothetical protein